MGCNLLSEILRAGHQVFHIHSNTVTFKDLLNPTIPAQKRRRRWMMLKTSVVMERQRWEKTAHIGNSYKEMWKKVPELIAKHSKKRK